MNLDLLVIATLGGMVGVIAVYFVFETWLLAWERRIPSPLVRTLYRAGADPQRLAARAMAGEIALAEGRCPSCPAIGSCREWLESGTQTGYRAFCPNAALVERVTERGAR